MACMMGCSPWVKKVVSAVEAGKIDFLVQPYHLPHVAAWIVSNAVPYMPYIVIVRKDDPNRSARILAFRL